MLAWTVKEWNGLEVEQYLFFDLNRDEGIAQAKALFDRLKAPGP